MTITIHEIGNGTGMELIASGTIYDKQMLSALSEVYSCNKFSQIKYLLIDRSACTRYYFSHEEIRAMVDLARTAASVNPHVVKAIVSPNAFSNNIAKLWKAQLVDHFANIGTFRNREDAIDWIQKHLSDAELPKYECEMVIKPNHHSASGFRV